MYACVCVLSHLVQNNLYTLSMPSQYKENANSLYKEKKLTVPHTEVGCSYPWTYLINRPMPYFMWIHNILHTKTFLSISKTRQSINLDAW